jgi:hypothetical protein
MSFVKVRVPITGIQSRWSPDGGGVPVSGDEGNMVELLIVVVVGLLVILAQRKTLLDARDDGNFSADALNAVLTVLDADQISLGLKGVPTDHG